MLEQKIPPERLDLQFEDKNYTSLSFRRLIIIYPFPCSLIHLILKTLTLLLSLPSHLQQPSEASDTQIQLPGIDNPPETELEEPQAKRAVSD